MLPVGIQVDAQIFSDQRNPSLTRDFTKHFLDVRSAEVSRSVPPGSAAIGSFIKERIALDFDHVFDLFVTSTRSPIFRTAFDTASKAINETMPLRRQAGIKGPLLVKCYDSLNIFTGYGVQVMEALRQFDAEPPVANIRDNMQKSIKNAYSYIAPSNLDFILTRAKTKGEKSVGAFGAAAAKILGLLPIISCNQGVTSSVAKVRGAAAARSYVLDLTRRELARRLLSPYITCLFQAVPTQWPPCQRTPGCMRKPNTKALP